MNELVVGEGTEVTLHFSLKLENGDVVDSNFEGAPASFVVGDGKLLPGYEETVLGLRSGESCSAVVPPEKGFGQPNPDNVQQVKRSSFDNGIELAEGLVVSFADAAGAELPGVVKAFDDREVTVDFNHPLAGHSITFEAKIVSVKPAVQH